MSPRERTYAPVFLVGADPSEGRLGSAAKTIGLFALIALPIGFLLSAAQSRQQTSLEKAEFRRVGLDWNKRHQYPQQ